MVGAAFVRLPEISSFLIFEEKRTRLAIGALPEKLLPFLANAFLVPFIPATDLDRGVPIACRALEVIAELSVLHGNPVAVATAANGNIGLRRGCLTDFPALGSDRRRLGSGLLISGCSFGRALVTSFETFWPRW